MIFRRKKKMVVKKPRLDADQVIIGAARTIGTAVGTASGAYEIGRQSAAQARTIDTEGMKQAAASKKALAAERAKVMRAQAEETGRAAAKKVEKGRKAAVARSSQVKKMATVRAQEAQITATGKVDELREAAAEKIAPKKKRGLLGRLRS